VKFRARDPDHDLDVFALLFGRFKPRPAFFVLDHHHPTRHCGALHIRLCSLAREGKEDREPATVSALGARKWHSLGMFTPSFVTGHLISRLGLTRIMLTGAVLLLL